VHYDGLLRPSEIKIHSLGFWVRFYDLPPAMMKEGVAKVLGGSWAGLSRWTIGILGI
jgi:hypothetical protein